MSSTPFLNPSGMVLKMTSYSLSKTGLRNCSQTVVIVVLIPSQAGTMMFFQIHVKTGPRVFFMKLWTFCSAGWMTFCQIVFVVVWMPCQAGTTMSSSPL